jgi:hypothetical protein
MRLALVVVVAMGSYIGWYGGSGVIARGCWGCIVGWCRMPVGHLECSKTEISRKEWEKEKVKVLKDLGVGWFETKVYCKSEGVEEADQKSNQE